MIPLEENPRNPCPLYSCSYSQMDMKNSVCRDASIKIESPITTPIPYGVHSCHEAGRALPKSCKVKQ